MAFAPTDSKPPYYPSYAPPEPSELSALFRSKAFLPEHGQGAWNETWKIQHNVYLTEEKESQMESAAVQKTTAQMLDMQKFLKTNPSNAAAAGAGSATAPSASALSGAAAATDPAALSDPALLIYSDPHAYAHYMERQNVQLFTLLSLSSEQWSELKNTPFLRYLYHGIFAVDIGRLETAWFDIAMGFLEKCSGVHTLLFHDGWNLTSTSGRSGGGKGKGKTRGHPVRERDGLLGGGSAGAPKKASAGGLGGVKVYPDEAIVSAKLHMFLPTFLVHNAGSLVHLELAGLMHMNIWPELIRLIKRCTGLQRLYLRACNIGDTHFALLSPVLRNHLPSLTHLQLSCVGLTAHSASLLASLIKAQSEKRSTVHWQTYLRSASPSVPPPSHSILLENSLGASGLISLDVSNNTLGDKGVSLLADTIGRDTWLKALDVAGNGFGEEGLRALVDMMQENKNLLWVQMQGARELNVNVHAASSSAEGGSAAKTLVPRVGTLAPGVPRAPVLSDASARLLQKFDPHFKKRNKRLLLLFHQQQLDTSKFTTGRDPLRPRVQRSGDDAAVLSPRQILSPRTRGSQIAPGAATVFDKFFQNNSAPPKQHSGSFDEDEGGGGGVQSLMSPKGGLKSSSSKKKKKRTGADTPLSPSVRSMAAAREAVEQLQLDSSRNSGRGSSKKKHRPSTADSAAATNMSSSSSASVLEPLPAALQFLFPQLALICLPEKLLHPDVSLRHKPPRTDNSWPSGYKPPPTSASDRSPSRSPSPSPRGSGRGASHSPKRPLSAKQARTVAAVAAATAQAAGQRGQEDPLASVHSHLDFRPMLKETAVGSTADYIAAEKAAYKRRLRIREEKAAAAAAKAARERGEEPQQQSPSMPLRQLHSATASPYSSSRALGGLRLGSPRGSLQFRSPPRSPLLAHAASAAGGSPSVRSLSPLDSPAAGNSRRASYKLAGQPLAAATGASVAAPAPQQPSADAVAELMAENQRLQRQLAQMAASTKRHSDAGQPSTGMREHQQQQPQSSASSRRPSAAAVDPAAPFDLSSLPHLLASASAAQESLVQDPEFVAYLEAQFEKLHAYMDCLEQQPTEVLAAAHASQQPPQQQPEESVQFAASAPAAGSQSQSVSQPPPLPREHHSMVQRVEQSASPDAPLLVPQQQQQQHNEQFPESGAAAASAPAATATAGPLSRPTVSRSNSADELEQAAVGEAGAIAPGTQPSTAAAASASSSSSAAVAPAAAAAAAPSSAAVVVGVAAASVNSSVVTVQDEKEEEGEEEEINEELIHEELQSGVTERMEALFGLNE